MLNNSMTLEPINLLSMQSINTDKLRPNNLPTNQRYDNTS